MYNIHWKNRPIQILIHSIFMEHSISAASSLDNTLFNHNILEPLIFTD